MHIHSLVNSISKCLIPKAFAEHFPIVCKGGYNVEVTDTEVPQDYLGLPIKTNQSPTVLRFSFLLYLFFWHHLLCSQQM